jgi:hypothetical protein
LPQLQVRILLSRIMGVSRNTLDAIDKGIAKQWMKQIGVYGVDDKNRCHVGLKLTFNWAAQTIHVLVLGDKEAIAETVSTEDELPPEVGNAISEFNQAIEAGHLRTECYCRYEQGLDPVATDKELGVTVAPPKISELPELQDTLKDFSPAHVPAEYRHALLQHLYAVDILTLSLSNTHGYPTISADDNSHLKAEGLPHITALRGQADLGRETTHEAEQATAVRRHVEQLREEAKIPQGIIIYQRGTLPENFERHTKQLVEALGNEQHSLRRPAEQALKGFAVATEKNQLSSLSQASREYHLPLKNLSRWVALNLIPVKYRDKDTIYIAKESLEEVARIYEEAKVRGVPPAKLLKELRASRERRDTET